MTPSGTFVAYYRVSTKRQGASGLGLEAQKSAVQRYLDGGKWSLLAEFTEIESGKNAASAGRRSSYRFRTPGRPHPPPTMECEREFARVPLDVYGSDRLSAPVTRPIHCKHVGQRGSSGDSSSSSAWSQRCSASICDRLMLTTKLGSGVGGRTSMRGARSRIASTSTDNSCDTAAGRIS
jgi:Resolvase, N terminal domain